MHVGRKIGVAGIVAGALATGCGGRQLLHVAPDDSSTEKRLAEYLTAQGLKVELVNDSPKDQLVLLDFEKSEDLPEFRIAIDTLVSGEEGKQVQARVVVVRLLSHQVVPQERREEALAVINSHHFQYWAGCFYLNEKDSEVEAQWPIDIKSDYGVDPAQVDDAMNRLITSWSVLYPTLAPLLGPPAAPPAERPTETASR